MRFHHLRLGNQLVDRLPLGIIEDRLELLFLQRAGLVEHHVVGLLPELPGRFGLVQKQLHESLPLLLAERDSCFQRGQGKLDLGLILKSASLAFLLFVLARLLVVERALEDLMYSRSAPPIACSR